MIKPGRIFSGRSDQQICPTTEECRHDSSAVLPAYFFTRRQQGICKQKGPALFRARAFRPVRLPPPSLSVEWIDRGLGAFPRAHVAVGALGTTAFRRKACTEDP